MKFGGSSFTFMVSRLSYARTRSVVLIYDSSTIKTDQVAVQLRHWYGSNTLCHGCMTLGRALLRSLALKHDVCTFTGACRRFKTILTLTGEGRQFSTLPHDKMKRRCVQSSLLYNLTEILFKERNRLFFHHHLLMKLELYPYDMFQTFRLLTFQNYQIIFKYVRTYIKIYGVSYKVHHIYIYIYILYLSKSSIPI